MFRELKRGDNLGSNYRLLSEPMLMKVRVIPVLDAEGVLQWEDDGGACAPSPYEVDLEERHRSNINLQHIGRKQRAARLAVPRESIRLVNLAEPALPEVVEARLNGKDEQQVKVVELEARLRRLLGLAK